jgi:hypothetical protein
MNLIVKQISGTPACVDRAKEAVEDKCKQLDKDRQDRALRSHELKVIVLL